MINEQLFNWAIELLKENFPREHEKRKLESKAVLALWKECFDEELTDQEFAVAVKYICRNFDFLPAPAKLVEHINGGKEAKAIQEWQTIVGYASDCRNEAQLVSLGNRARVALQAIGGLSAVGYADQITCQRLEKSFITVYCQCSAKDNKSLPQASYDTAPEAVEVDVEPAPMPEHIKVQFEAFRANFEGSKKKAPVPQEKTVPSRELPEDVRKEIEAVMARTAQRVKPDSQPVKLGDLVEGLEF
jgi:hypothetical protein